VHANVAAVYRRNTAELESLLEDTEHKDEAMELIRSLVEKIVRTFKEGGGLEAIVHGDLARILVLCSTNAEEAMPRGTARVAGSRQAKALAWFFQSRALRVFGCGDRI
jgi:hypothetical protein